MNSKYEPNIRLTFGEDMKMNKETEWSTHRKGMFNKH